MIYLLVAIGIKDPKSVKAGPMAPDLSQQATSESPKTNGT